MDSASDANASRRSASAASTSKNVVFYVAVPAPALSGTIVDVSVAIRPAALDAPFAFSKIRLDDVIGSVNTEADDALLARRDAISVQELDGWWVFAFDAMYGATVILTVADQVRSALTTTPLIFGADAIPSLSASPFSSCHGLESFCAFTMPSTSSYLTVSEGTVATTTHLSYMDCTALTAKAPPGATYGPFEVKTMQGSYTFNCTREACAVSSNPAVRAVTGGDGTCIVELPVEPMSIYDFPTLKAPKGYVLSPIHGATCTTYPQQCLARARGATVRVALPTSVHCSGTAMYDAFVVRDYDTNSPLPTDGASRLICNYGFPYSVPLGMTRDAPATYAVMQAQSTHTHFFGLGKADDRTAVFDVVPTPGAICGRAGCLVRGTATAALRTIPVDTIPSLNGYAYIDISQLAAFGSFKLRRTAWVRRSDGQSAETELLSTVSVDSRVELGTSRCAVVSGDTRGLRIHGAWMGAYGPDGAGGDGYGCLLEVEVSRGAALSVAPLDGYPLHLDRSFHMHESVLSKREDVAPSASGLVVFEAFEVFAFATLSNAPSVTHIKVAAFTHGEFPTPVAVAVLSDSLNLTVVTPGIPDARVGSLLPPRWDPHTQVGTRFNGQVLSVYTPAHRQTAPIGIFVRPLLLDAAGAVASRMHPALTAHLQKAGTCEAHKPHSDGQTLIVNCDKTRNALLLVYYQVVSPTMLFSVPSHDTYLVLSQGEFFATVNAGTPVDHTCPSPLLSGMGQYAICVVPGPLETAASVRVTTDLGATAGGNIQRLDAYDPAATSPPTRIAPNTLSLPASRSRSLVLRARAYSSIDSGVDTSFVVVRNGAPAVPVRMMAPRLAAAGQAYISLAMVSGAFALGGGGPGYLASPDSTSKVLLEQAEDGYSHLVVQSGAALYQWGGAFTSTCVGALCYAGAGVGLKVLSSPLTSPTAAFVYVDCSSSGVGPALTLKISRKVLGTDDLVHMKCSLEVDPAGTTSCNIEWVPSTPPHVQTPVAASVGAMCVVAISVDPGSTVDLGGDCEVDTTYADEATTNHCSEGSTQCSISDIASFAYIAVRPRLTCGIETAYRSTVPILVSDTPAEILAKVGCSAGYQGYVIPHPAYACTPESDYVVPPLRGCGRCRAFSQAGYVAVPYSLGSYGPHQYTPAVPTYGLNDYIQATRYRCDTEPDGCEDPLCSIGRTTGEPEVAGSPPTCRELPQGSGKYGWDGRLTGCSPTCPRLELPGIFGRGHAVTLMAPLTASERAAFSTSSLQTVVTSLDCARGWVRSAANVATLLGSAMLSCTNGKWDLSQKLEWCTYPESMRVAPASTAIAVGYQPCGRFVPRPAFVVSFAASKANFDVAHGAVMGGDDDSIGCAVPGSSPPIGYAQCNNGKWTDKLSGCVPTQCPLLTVPHVDRLISRAYNYDVRFHTISCASGAVQVSAPQGSFRCRDGEWEVDTPFSGCTLPRCEAGDLFRDGHLGYSLWLGGETFTHGQTLADAPASVTINCAVATDAKWAGSVTTPRSDIRCVGGSVVVTSLGGRLHGCRPQTACTMATLSIPTGYAVDQAVDGGGAPNWATVRCAHGYAQGGAPIEHPSCGEGRWASTLWTGCLPVACNGVVTRCTGTCRPAPGEACVPMAGGAQCCQRATAVAADAANVAALVRPPLPLSSPDGGFGVAVAWSSATSFAVLRGMPGGVQSAPAVYVYALVHGLPAWSTVEEIDLGALTGSTTAHWHTLLGTAHGYVAVAEWDAATSPDHVVIIPASGEPPYAMACTVTALVCGVAAAADDSSLVLLHSGATGTVFVDVLRHGGQTYTRMAELGTTISIPSGSWDGGSTIDRRYVAVSSPYIYIGEWSPGHGGVQVLRIDTTLALVELDSTISMPALAVAPTPTASTRSMFGYAVSAVGSMVVIGAPGFASCSRGTSTITSSVGVQPASGEEPAVAPFVCHRSGAVFVFRRLEQQHAAPSEHELEAALHPPTGVGIGQQDGSHASTDCGLGLSVSTSPLAPLTILSGARVIAPPGVSPAEAAVVAPPIAGQAPPNVATSALIVYRVAATVPAMASPRGGPWPPRRRTWRAAHVVGYTEWRSTPWPIPPATGLFGRVAAMGGNALVVGCPDMIIPHVSAASVTTAPVPNDPLAVATGAVLFHTVPDLPMGDVTESLFELRVRATTNDSSLLLSTTPTPVAQWPTEAAALAGMYAGLRSSLPGAPCGAVPLAQLVGVSPHSASPRAPYCGRGALSGTVCDAEVGALACDGLRGFCGRPSGRLRCESGVWTGQLECQPCVCKRPPVAPPGSKFVVGPSCKDVAWRGTCVLVCPDSFCGAADIVTCSKTSVVSGVVVADWDRAPVASQSSPCGPCPGPPTPICQLADLAAFNIVVPGERLVPGQKTHAQCAPGYCSMSPVTITCADPFVPSAFSGLCGPCSRPAACPSSAYASMPTHLNIPGHALQALYRVTVEESAAGIDGAVKRGHAVRFECTPGACTDEPAYTSTGYAVCAGTSADAEMIHIEDPTHCRPCVPM